MAGRTAIWVGLIVSSAIALVFALYAFAELIQNAFEPGCDEGYLGRDASYCDINGQDYVNAAPYATVAVVATLLAAMCVAVLIRAHRRTATARRVASSTSTR